jgi:hypothetical protein
LTYTLYAKNAYGHWITLVLGPFARNTIGELVSEIVGLDSVRDSTLLGRCASILNGAGVVLVSGALGSDFGGPARDRLVTDVEVIPARDGIDTVVFAVEPRSCSLLTSVCLKFAEPVFSECEALEILTSAVLPL